MRKNAEPYQPTLSRLWKSSVILGIALLCISGSIMRLLQIRYTRGYDGHVKRTLIDVLVGFHLVLVGSGSYQKNAENKRKHYGNEARSSEVFMLGVVRGRLRLAVLTQQDAARTW